MSYSMKFYPKGHHTPLVYTHLRFLLVKRNSRGLGIFWINPPDGRGHGLKCIESKNRRHFEKPTFLVLQLCTSNLGWCLKNAPCLWFGCFSSDVKRCRHARVQSFMLELKRPNQRQGAFLRHLKYTNHPGYEVQSCSTKKVGNSKWHMVFDSMHFRPCPLPSSGFIQKIPHESGFHLTRVIQLHWAKIR